MNLVSNTETIVALPVMPCQMNGEKRVGYTMMGLPCLAICRMIVVASHESPLQGTNTSKTRDDTETVLIRFFRLLEASRAVNDATGVL